MSSSGDPVIPVLDGTINIPEAIDFNLKKNPNQPAFVFSHDSTPSIATTITHLEFARACHRVAHKVRPGRSGQRGQVVAIIALVDTVVYHAIVAGLMQAGLTPFPISPRNSPPAIVNLLKASSCHTVISTQETLRGLLQGVRAELSATYPDFDLNVWEAPALNEIYPKLGSETINDSFTPYPPSPTRAALTDVAIYLHSSGSTGFPKCIPQSHMIMVEWASFSLFRLQQYRPQLCIGTMALPAFHTLGLYSQLLQAIYGLIAIAVFPPVVTAPNMQPLAPTSDNILDHLRRTSSTGLVIIPALLHIWAQSEDAINQLKELVFIRYAGGPLAEKLGDKLAAAGVNVQAVYGGTEFGPLTMPRLHRGQEADWEWLEFSDRPKLRWVSQGDGTYECQTLTTEKHHPAIENMSEPRGYATSDLFKRHPTKPHLWKIVGRIDDVIIHSSGEKTVPGPMEEVMMSSPLIRGVVMFGRNHDQAGVLLELSASSSVDEHDTKQIADFRNRLWPIVEESNKNAPAFSRIFKEMIFIVPSDRPLPRSPKGTVMRKAALKLFETEIENLYKIVESTAGGQDVTPPDDWSIETVTRWLLEQAVDVQSGKELSASKDLFDQGFDSLSATILRLRIVGALRSSKNNAAAAAVSQNTVYTYPTIESLANFLSGIVTDPETSKSTNNGKAAIETMIEKYSMGLDTPTTNSSKSWRKSYSGSESVLITGTTGNIGAQMLATLLNDDRVKIIFALNRLSSSSQSILQRQEARFEDKGLDKSLLQHSKLQLIEGDAAEDLLGLTQPVYETLRDRVTMIIHNAWRLDFNLTLPSFESNIRGTRNLIDFARSGANSSILKFLFTSSIASAQSWDQSRGPYPEELVSDAKHAVGGGYGEGKYVAERLLAASGLQVCSLRLGQISGGAPNGAWATSDWVPILVKSSLAIGALPLVTGTVAWLPMDAASQALLDIAFNEEPSPFAANLVHPRPVSWNTIIDPLSRLLAKDGNSSPIPIVPLQEWVSQLEQKAKNINDENVGEIPAIKLLPFFRSMAASDAKRRDAATQQQTSLYSFETTKAQAFSETLKEVRPLDSQDVERWVSYWRTVGYLH